MIHALLTLVWCAGCFFLGAPWPFLFWLPAFYLGREHAQAEQRWIDTHGGHRDRCPWWMGFHPFAWTAKGVFDWLLPLAVSLAAWLAQAVFWKP